jgi:hypothetical protein
MTDKEREAFDEMLAALKEYDANRMVPKYLENTLLRRVRAAIAKAEACK